MFAPPRLARASRRTRGLAVVPAAVALLVLLIPAPAFADRDYTVRFTENAQGDITGTGNALLSCRGTDADCARARNGQGSVLNNNNIAMDHVDIDGDPATFDSSAATLSLPPGARVLFAGLYYGGRTQAGSGGSPAPDVTARNKVLIRPPNLGAYIERTARPADVDDAPVNPAPAQQPSGCTRDSSTSPTSSGAPVRASTPSRTCNSAPASSRTSPAAGR